MSNALPETHPTRDEPRADDVPLSRRDVIAAAFAACATCSLAAEFAAAAASTAPVDVGTLDAFAKDGAYDTWTNQGFFIVREGKKLYAPSSSCTHKTAQLVSKAGALKCPKHGTIYTTAGEVQKGPAKTALPRLGIRRDERGHIIVDPAKRFTSKSWSDSDSFLSL